MVGRLACALMGEPLLVHSTSWRKGRGAVLLTFLVVYRDRQAPRLEGVPEDRAQLARSGAVNAPPAIDHEQVLEHGMRHLAWLLQDDDLVQ